MNTTTILRALVLFAVMPAVAWANVGPPDVGWNSRHGSDPPNVVSRIWLVQCAEVPCKSLCLNMVG